MSEANIIHRKSGPMTTTFTFIVEVNISLSDVSVVFDNRVIPSVAISSDIDRGVASSDLVVRFVIRIPEVKRGKDASDFSLPTANVVVGNVVISVAEIYEWHIIYPLR